MGAGIFLPFAAIAAADIQSRVITSNAGKLTSTGVDLATYGSWTPPQYSVPSLTTLIVPSMTSNTSGQIVTISTVYVFDAVFRLAHHRTLTKTQHPVLTGANISDHAYIQPSRVILEIGMSDAMSSFTEGVWVGSATKSISAWQILKQLQVSKTLLTLSTRLDTYYNMLILNMDSPDDNKTKFALKASVVLEETLSASVSSQPSSSARPQTSNSTSGGIVQSTVPNPQQVQRNVIPSTLYPDTPTYPNVPGAGNVSSVSLGTTP